MEGRRCRASSVGMDDGVVASLETRVESGHEEIDDEAVLDFADPEQVRAGTRLHLRDHRCQLGRPCVTARRR
jgi:hypothetical protein